MALEAGKYKAKIKDYGFTVPKDETKQPQAMIQFEVDVPEDENNPMGAPARTENIIWFGSFNGGALAITTKTLVETLGFTGKTGAELAGGIGSGALNEEREYELEIEMNTWNDKTSPKVKYINIPGQVRRAERLDAAGAKVFVGGLNLAGELASVRASLKAEGKKVDPPKAQTSRGPAPAIVKPKPQPQQDAEAPEFDSEEEVPF